MKRLIILFFLIISNILSAQVTQEWLAIYNGTGVGYNIPKKSGIDIYGNYIVAGSSYSTNGYDYIILKYNPSGNLLWKQRYNGLGNSIDYLTGMVLDDSGNIYVTGESNEGTAKGGINWVTIKYDRNGQMLWKRSLNWTANNTDEPFGMNIDNDRNIYVIGFGRVTSLERALVTIKYNSIGDSIWTTNYTSLPNRSNWGYSIETDDSNNVYSSGYGAVPTGNEIITIKYDSKGNKKWVRKYPTYEGDYLRPTLSAIDRNNNLLLVGYSYVSNNYDFVTLKYSSEGNLVWDRLFAGANDDYAHSLFLDDKNNLLIGGSSYSIGFADYLILKYSSCGDTLLIKMFDGGGLLFDQIYSIVSDESFNIYFTGYAETLSGLSHYLTMKTNSFGEVIWSQQYLTPYHNYSYCLNLDSNDCVFVSGSSGSPGDNSSIVSIKYSQITGMVISEPKSKNKIVIYNYPNPFNSSTEISYILTDDNFVKISLFDISGKELETLINEFKKKGGYKLIFYGEKYSSGVYFYSLEINNMIVQTNKMLILK